MPRTPWGPQQNDLLGGLFGVLQSASAARTSTAQLWSDLRTAAVRWQQSTFGASEDLTDAEIQARGAEILRNAGVNIQNVNTYRALAGQWRTAKERLAQLAPDQQVTGQEIFVPPWGRTVNTAVPDRYRLRIHWTIEPAEGEAMEKWSSYEVTTPAGSIGDLLDQAREQELSNDTDSFGARQMLLQAGGGELGIDDYELEQI